MEVTGKIKLVGETNTFGSSGFRKREVVVVTDEKYPQPIMIEFVQDNCDLLNGYKVDEQVNVQVNLRGNEWTSPDGKIKYFNSIQGWRIERCNASAVSSPDPIVNKDDLPF